MSEENKTVEVKQECFCKSEWFKKFITKTLAVFIGTLCALSLFAALHKPPVMKPVTFHGGMMRPCHCQMHHFYKHKPYRGDFQRKFEKKDFQRVEKRDFERKVPIETK